MKKLLILFLLFSATAYADMYAVERPDGSVSVVNHIGGDSLEDVLGELGFSGYPIIRISASDLPPREDRSFWAFNDIPVGKKLKVDSVKKAQKEAEKQAKEAEKDAVLTKLKISREEARLLRDV